MTTFKEAFENMDKLDLTMEKKYIEIDTIEIAGFASVLQALRLPFGLECRSEIINNNFAWIGDVDKGLWITYNGQCAIHEKDLHLLSTLIKRGDEHSKCIRGLLVYAEINAPRYFWQEMVTYEVGAIKLSSESTMHIQGKGLSTEELVRMKDKLEEGTMQKRIEAFSYQTLRRIYKQRRNHRLPHWQEFTKWIESLPFAKELILIGLDNE